MKRKEFMKKLVQVQIAGTWREYAWGTQIQKRKRKDQSGQLTTKVLSKEDAERIFSQKQWERFSPESSKKS